MRYLLLALCLMAPSLTAQAVPPPPVIVFVIDDLADRDFDVLRAKYAFPSFDRLESRGVRYRRFYTHARCQATRQSLLRGIGPVDVGSLACTGALPVPPRQAPTLAKSFDASGYRTAAFGKWHLAGSTLTTEFWLTPQILGFNTWRAGSSDNLANCGGSGYYAWDRSDDAPPVFTTEYHTEAIWDALLGWVASTSPTLQRFVWFAPQAPHFPWLDPVPASLLPPGYVRPPMPTNRDGYEELMLSIDVLLGRMLDEFPDARMVVLSDNGTSPFTLGPGQDPAKVKMSMFEDGVRSYLCISGPGLEPLENDDVISVVDVMPTILDAVGIQIPFAARQDGESLVATLLGGSSTRGWAWCHDADPDGLACAVEADWKLMRDVAGVETLYSLVCDPDETMALDPSQGPPATVALLRAILDGQGAL